MQIDSVSQMTDRYSEVEIKNLQQTCTQFGIEFEKIVGRKEYVYPEDLFLSKKIGNGIEPTVSWEKEDKRPKALFVMACGFAEDDRIYLRETITDIKKTYSIQVRHIDPKKTADELWGCVEKITRLNRFFEK